MKLQEYIKLDSLLNKTIGQTIHKAGMKGFRVGIEFENELCNKGRYSGIFSEYMQNFGCRLDIDGSLRGGGVEVITPAWKIDQLEANIDKLCEVANKEGEWSFSRRTSTHMHFNMLDLKAYDVFKFLALYWILEPTLFLETTPVRRHNTFCVSRNDVRRRLLDSVFHHYTLKSGNLEENLVKYSSMNLAPLNKIGTVECRFLPATWDAATIRRWVCTFEKIYNMSLKFKDLIEIKKMFMDLSPQFFLEVILEKQNTEHYLKLAKDEGANLDELIREGYEYSRPMLAAERRWTEINDIFKAENSPEKVREREIEYAKQDPLQVLGAQAFVARDDIPPRMPRVQWVEAVAQGPAPPQFNWAPERPENWMLDEIVEFANLIPVHNIVPDAPVVVNEDFWDFIEDGEIREEGDF